MRKAEEFLRHAEECRQMMQTARPEYRAQLQNMADTWEQLADSRRRQLERNSETDPK